MRSGDEAVSDSSTVVVRTMSVADSADVLAILKESPEAAQWSEESFRDSTTSLTGWVAGPGRQAAGFLVGRTVADEFEILNMAVAAAHRRRGIGARLLSEALAWSRQAGARRAYLEVRLSNRAAISLYARHGFCESGRRTRYYVCPVEDAILFSLEISAMP